MKRAAFGQLFSFHNIVILNHCCPEKIALSFLRIARARNVPAERKSFC